MTRARLSSVERRAFRLFAEAVGAFADDPGPANLERYLAASRLLDESKRARARRVQARPRIVVTGSDAA